MSVILYLLRRIFLPARHGLLQFTSWVAIGSVALAVAQLIIVLAVLSGFLRFFETSYSRMASDIIAIPHNRNLSVHDLKQELDKEQELSATSLFAVREGMASHQGLAAGMVLEGIDPRNTFRVIPWQQLWVDKSSTLMPPHGKWIWLGVQLAKKLHIQLHDTLSVLVPSEGRPVRLSLEVTALYKSGIYEHDLHYAATDLATLKELSPQDQNELVQCKCAPQSNLKDTVAHLRQHFGERAHFKTWIDLHHNMLLAVRQQKLMLFFILQIVVALAFMNVVNLLLMSHESRKEEVAILRILGLPRRGLLAVCLLQGMTIGAVGIGLGIVLGCAATYLLGTVSPVTLNESIYNVTALPVHIHIFDVFFIAVAAFVVCTVVSFLSGLQTTFRTPLGALRNG